MYNQSGAGSGIGFKHDRRVSFDAVAHSAGQGLFLEWGEVLGGVQIGVDYPVPLLARCKLGGVWCYSIHHVQHTHVQACTLHHAAQQSWYSMHHVQQLWCLVACTMCSNHSGVAFNIIYAATNTNRGATSISMHQHASCATTRHAL